MERMEEMGLEFIGGGSLLNFWCEGVYTCTISGCAIKTSLALGWVLFVYPRNSNVVI